MDTRRNIDTNAQETRWAPAANRFPAKRPEFTFNIQWIDFTLASTPHEGVTTTTHGSVLQGIYRLEWTIGFLVTAGDAIWMGSLRAQCLQFSL
jgi:glyoxylate utilization-related uncharacterized protein